MNKDMGMPAGKPKTIAVPVEFLSASRKVRIVTNLCVYWDEIFLSEQTAAPTVRPTDLPVTTADLRFGATSSWEPTPGLYTRYGEVGELLRQVDDRLVVMGAGDQLGLTFDASGLHALPSAWRRDFLLLVDGWAKDRDANTSFSQTVEPLPFHNMSRYGDPYPGDPAHEAYPRQYNTRPAHSLLTRLRPAR